MRLLALSVLLVTSSWAVSSSRLENFEQFGDWVLRGESTVLHRNNRTTLKTSSGSKKAPKDFTFKDVLEEMEYEAMQRLEEVIEQLGSPVEGMADYLEKRATGAADDKDLIPNYLKPVALYLPINAEPLSACSIALLGMSKTENLWAAIMMDSWGKIPDGLLYGNIQVIGMSEECVAINASDSFTIWGQPIPYHVEGRYCLVTVSHEASMTAERSNLGVQVFPRRQLPFLRRSYEEEEPEERGAMFVPMYGIPYTYGTCMPDVCTPDMLKDSIAYALDNDTFHARVDCQVHPDKLEMQPAYNAGDIAFVVVMGIIGTLAVVAAIFDILLSYFRREEAKQGPLKYLLVFSCYTNLKKMFHLDFHNKSNNITCLHGLRVLSMTWVVMGHEYFVLTMRAKNLLGLVKLNDDALDQTITNATVSVDSFFFMSGLLVAHGILREMDRTKRFNVIMFYVHRVIRLMPPILMSAAFMATVARFLVVGPYAPRFEKDVSEMCRHGWWYDALFITNLMFSFADEPSCIGQAWYVGVDTQLYIIAPLIIVPIFYRRILGLSWLGVMTVVSLIIPGVIIGVNNIPPTSLLSPLFSQEAGANYQKLVYFTPWCRASAYFAGFWAGVILFLIAKKKIVLQWPLVLAGWVCAATLALLVLYGMTPYNVIVDPSPMSEGVSIMYGACHRFVWSVALLWVVFACHTGYGGPVNWFLSHPGFQPLSKITYCMFLISIPIQEMLMYSTFETIHLDHTYAVTTTCGVLFLSALASIILSLATEGPVLGLEKLLLRRPGRGPPEAKENGLPTTVAPRQEDVNGTMEKVPEVSESPVPPEPENAPEDLPETEPSENPPPPFEEEGDTQETQEKTSAIVHVNEGFVEDENEKLSKF